MTMITPELRQAIEQAGDEPARLVDPETNTTYLLVRADRFEALDPDREIVADMSPLLADLSPEDWEDASNYGL